MNLLLEVLMDLIVEGSIEISSNKKVSKWIRYPLICLIILFFIVVIVGLFVIGIILLNRNILASIILIIISVIMMIGTIIKCKKVYEER